MRGLPQESMRLVRAYGNAREGSREYLGKNGRQCLLDPDGEHRYMRQRGSFYCEFGWYRDFFVPSSAFCAAWGFFLE